MKMNDKISISLQSSLLLLAMAVSANAAPILFEWQDGTAGHLFANWSSQEKPGENSDVTLPGTSVLTIDTGPGNVGTPVGPNLNAISVSGSSSATGVDDLYYTTAFGTLDLNNYAGISFDFYAQDAVEVVDFGFYFHNTAQQVWYYSIDATLTSGVWDNYSASFTYSDSWYGFGLTLNTYNEISSQANFEAALSDVNRLGFYITHSGTVSDPGQLYGIDNFGLTVPEPETYMVLGMALLTVAFVFRKRITESLAEARSMMQA